MDQDRNQIFFKIFNFSCSAILCHASNTCCSVAYELIIKRLIRNPFRTDAK